MNRGDDVIAALARERGRALVAYAYLLTGDMRDAEDLAQDALVKTVVRTRSGLDLDTAEAYVRRVMASTFVDGRRRWRRWTDALPKFRRDADETAPDGADRITAQVAVREALGTLPPRERSCVVLRYFEDMSVAQIADTLNLSTGTVKRYLSDAIHRLEAVIGPIDSPVTTVIVERSAR